MRWIGGAEGEWHDPSNWEDYGSGDIEILPVNSPPTDVIITAKEDVSHICEYITIGNENCDRVKIIFEENVNFQIINEQPGRHVHIRNADIIHYKDFIINTIDGILYPETISMYMSYFSTLLGYGEFSIESYSTSSQGFNDASVDIFGGCLIDNRKKFNCGSMAIYPNKYWGDVDFTETIVNIPGELNIVRDLDVIQQSCNLFLYNASVMNVDEIFLIYDDESVHSFYVDLGGGQINVGYLGINLNPETEGTQNEFIVDMNNGEVSVCEVFVYFLNRTPIENFVVPKVEFQNTENSKITFNGHTYIGESEESAPYFYIYSNYKIDGFVLPETVEIIGDIDIGFDSTDWQHGSEGITFSSIKDLKFIGTDVENEATIYGYNYNFIGFKAQNLEVLPFENGIYKIRGNYGDGCPKFIIGGNYNTIVDLENCHLKVTKAVQPENGKTYYKALTRKGNVDDGDNEGWLFEESTTFSTPIEITERTTESVKAAVEILEYDPATSKTPQILSLQGMLETYNLEQYSSRVPFVVNYAKPDAEYRFDLLSELEETPDILEKVSMTEPYWSNGTSFVTDQIYFTPIYTGGYELVLFENDIEVDRVQISVEEGGT